MFAGDSKTAKVGEGRATKGALVIEKLSLERLTLSGEVEMVSNSDSLDKQQELARTTDVFNGIASFNDEERSCGIFTCNRRLALAPRRLGAFGCSTAVGCDSPSFASIRRKFSMASWRMRSTFFSLRNPRYGQRRIPSERHTRISVRLLIPRSSAAFLAVNVKS